jgi:hypothetical protein
MTAKLVVDVPGIRLYHGRADEWAGGEAIDLVFTNPYGPLPASLYKTPLVVHQWLHRRWELFNWCGSAKLRLIGTWNGGREAFWAANVAAMPLDLSEFRPEPGGWYPPDLVRRILALYAIPGLTIWDGFMGRATVGKVAREFGCAYVGVEELESHLALAREYLGV